MTWNQKTQKWRAQINISGKRTSLGSFGDLRDAATAYTNAAKEEHGEFVCLRAK